MSINQLPLLLLSILVACVWMECEAELFTAMSHLEPLARFEQNVGLRIDEYIGMEMDRIGKLRQMANQYQQAYQKRKSEGVENLAKNSLNRFLSLKRVTSDWRLVNDFIWNGDSANKFLSNITGLPSEEDLKGAATAIFRIQDVYRLTVGDLADGKISGVRKLDHSMTAHDCFDIGRQAYLDYDYYHAIQWMDEALRRVRNEKNPTVNEIDIYDYLSFALYQQENLQQAWFYAKKILAKRPDDERIKINVKSYAKEMAEAGIKQNSPLPPIMNMRPVDAALPERDTYEALCRGEVSIPEEEKKLLHCYYKRDRPLLKLAPVKVEVVHLKPMAVLFRNVLSDREIEVIKGMATPMFKRATVHNKATGQLEHANYRISKSAWLKSYHHPAIARINLRLEDMTNLDQDAAEDFQYDALFWYNLHPNGESDDRTRHAACPVLAGQKWVSNKWIHERRQEFRRPCTLEEEGEEGRVPELDRYNHCHRK